ncbi:hypothetical protein F4777DRAFT_454740 [Nemania sp. FL0916]|nr:hypothetical protein F4777DRAFT_454740 [Nemania sp. FL0916]
MGATLLVESSIWWGFTLVFVAARIASRKALLGSFRKFQIDDALMILALSTHTVFVVTINILSDKNSNLIEPNHIPKLTPEDIAEREYGSKLVLVVEQSQISTIWLVKTCLLLMYNRLTFSKIQKLCVKLVAGYVAFGWVLMEILYFGVWCRPFSEYWAVPPNSIQCSAVTNHLITNAVLNISSDIFIIIIPMPVFLQINIAPRKKAVLCCVFALGLFTIGAAVANKYYSFTQPWSTEWTYWYVRESSTALIVSNIPFLWTTLRFFVRLTSSRSGGGGSPAPGRADKPVSLSLGTAYGHNTPSVNHNTIISRGSHGVDIAADFDFHRLDSQEDVNTNKYYADHIPLKIYKRQEIHVTSELSDGTGDPLPTADRVSFKI